MLWMSVDSCIEATKHIQYTYISSAEKGASECRDVVFYVYVVVTERKWIIVEYFVYFQ